MMECPQYPELLVHLKGIGLCCNYSLEVVRTAVSGAATATNLKDPGIF